MTNARAKKCGCRKTTTKRTTVKTIRAKRVAPRVMRGYWVPEEGDEDYDPYTLIGIDGNAVSVMNYTANCMKKEKMNPEPMYKKAMSGDYNNLLSVCLDYIEKCNKSWHKRHD